MSCSLPLYDLCINQNSTYKFSMTLTDSTGSAVPISLWSFTGSIKQTFDDADPPHTFFTMSVLDYTSSLVQAYLTPSQTEGLTEKKYVYDIIATNHGASPWEVYRILQGKITVNPGITDSEIGV